MTLRNHGDRRIMSHRKRQFVLFSLALAHVLAGMTAVYLARPLGYGFRTEIKQMFPEGLVFASASLLGIWIAMGTTSLRIRLGSSALGSLFTGYLYMLIRSHHLRAWFSPTWTLRPAFLTHGRVSYAGAPVPVFSPAWLEAFFPSVLIMSSVAAFVAALLRLERRFELRLTDCGHSSSGAAPFQFSLRTLLLFALAVGSVCSIARATHSQESNVTLLILGLSLSFAAATGAVSWTILATTSLLRRCFLAMLAAGGNALLLAYCYGDLTPLMLRSYVALAVSHALCVALSLLIVRWCGYRLLPKTPLPLPAATA
jgi:hypothetical protein